MQSKGFIINNKPNQLNIVGIRADSTEPNKFDDQIFVFWKNDADQWAGWKAPATTDPGTYWLNNPMQPQGTAILKAGQYVDTYKIDLHLGKYKALCQRLKPVTVIRDYDRDAILDFDNGTESTGMYGINIHRANRSGTTLTVDRNSAGCQVFANVDDFNELMKLADIHSAKYGNKFTYTLIDRRAFAREKKKRAVYKLAAVAGGSVAVTGLWLSLRKFARNKKSA